MEPEEILIEEMQKEGDMPLEFHIKDLDNYLDCLVGIVAHLKEIQYEFQEWVSYSELFVMKFTIHIYSIRKLCEGFEFNNNSITIEGIDISSIHVLNRALIENYLTYNYLYLSEISEDEKFFRFKLYEHAGIKNLSYFHSVLNYNDSEKEKYEEFLNELKVEVQNDEFYLKNIKGVNKREQAFKNYGLPIIKNSWFELIKNAKLKDNIFGVSYKLQCQFAHSEFLALSSFKKKGIFNKNNIDLNHDLIECLEMIKILISIIIVDFTKQFPPCEQVLEAFPENLKQRIAYWNVVGKVE